eukprot:TRINITY_DN74443_c0_g1_i1.p1 TRINITY_DN74443_c0_g1~~TRINITY_DN74443_c0_g1_i1.p1  ORF type:complete len:1155 (+),score=194.57 TRINITY_DN74443_c0_g1_i1:115-3579(+)
MAKTICFLVALLRICPQAEAAPVRSSVPASSRAGVFGQHVGGLQRELFSSRDQSTGQACDHGTEHSHPHVALLFMFVGIFIGLLTAHVISRKCHFIPFTVALFFEGVLAGCIHRTTNGGMGTFSKSLDMWVQMDPHLLLYAFLPALLFGDSMSMSWHEFRRCLAQCALLAGPGVVVGSTLTAFFARHVLKLDWDMNTCFAFGAILAATDPVAVVALLKDMGVDKTLTMQIAGESLLNDGVAIVIWTIFFQMAKGATYTPVDVVVFFLRLAAGGVILGKIFGLVSVFGISQASDKLQHSDHLVQLALTLTCAYLSFFVGEHVLGMSGVLACIFAALSIAKYGPPLFCSQEAVAHVWHAIEFIGNTLIFFLAGTIFGIILPTSSFNDCMLLILLWAGMMVVRGVMLVTFFPLLRNLGNGMTVREALVSWWGGLRGAVGLALALAMKKDDTFSRAIGDQIVFFVAGAAALTMLINATSCGTLVRSLRLTVAPKARHKLVDEIRFACAKSIVRLSSKFQKEAMFNTCWIDTQELRRYVSALRLCEELIQKMLSTWSFGRNCDLERSVFQEWALVTKEKRPVQASRFSVMGVRRSLSVPTKLGSGMGLSNRQSRSAESRAPSPPLVADKEPSDTVSRFGRRTLSAEDGHGWIPVGDPTRRANGRSVTATSVARRSFAVPRSSRVRATLRTTPAMTPLVPTYPVAGDPAERIEDNEERARVMRERVMAKGVTEWLNQNKSDKSVSADSVPNWCNGQNGFARSMFTILDGVQQPTTLSPVLPASDYEGSKSPRSTSDMSDGGGPQEQQSIDLDGADFAAGAGLPPTLPPQLPMTPPATLISLPIPSVASDSVMPFVQEESPTSSSLKSDEVSDLADMEAVVTEAGNDRLKPFDTSHCTGMRKEYSLPGVVIKENSTRRSFLEGNGGEPPHLAHAADGLDPDELKVERELFLSMLRSEYWAQMSEGRLPDHSQAALHLLRSVDEAFDTARHSLTDWSSVFASMCTSTLVSRLWWPLQKVYLSYRRFTQMSAGNAGFKVYVPCIAAGLQFDVFTCVCFVDAHLVVQQKMSNASILGRVTKARMWVLLESLAEVDMLWEFVDTHVDEQCIKKVRTKQLAFSLLTKQKEMIMGWQKMGMINIKEAEELLSVVRRDINALEATRAS